MSAIWGMIHHSEQVGEQQVKLMTHPYEEKCKLDRIESKRSGRLFFSCGIQYVTREAEREELPIEDENYIMTADCLLDNREELIRELAADLDCPDGRLIYLAYCQWGTDCFEHLQGLFSIAIYDKQKDLLYLAVDQVAQRCLYYYQDHGKRVFSTLIEPMLEVMPEVQPNRMYQKDFLTAYGMLPNISAVETPFVGVYQVQPGTYMTITREGATETRYWSPAQSQAKYTYRNAKVCGREFRQVYEGCLQRAIRTQGEVGAALSSGFDSASASSIAADLLRQQGKKLYTYTYVPAPEFDDRQRAHNNVLNEKEDVLRIVAMHPNMEPEFVYNEGRNCLENMQEMQSVMEIPYKAYVNIPNLNEIYDKASQKGCKVVLIGQCGNSTVSFGMIDNVLYELYDTGHRLKAALWLNRYSKTIRESRKQAFRFCLRLYRHAQEVYRQDPFQYELCNDWIREDILQDYPLEQRYRQSGRTKMEDLPIDRHTYRENLYSASMYTYLGAMETKLGLHQGVVLRDPTRDPEMLSFCYHMPFQYFAYRGVTRWLIREQCKDILPGEILQNYLRYGVQNMDWMKRIIRDKEQVLPVIRDNIIDSSMCDVFRLDEIKVFIDGLQEHNDWDEGKMMDLMYLYMEGTFEQYAKRWVK